MFPCIHHDQFYGTYVRTYVAECAVYTDTQNYQIQLSHASHHYILLRIPHLVGTQVPPEPQPCIDQVRHTSCRSPLIKNTKFLYTCIYTHTIL